MKVIFMIRIRGLVHGGFGPAPAVTSRSAVGTVASGGFSPISVPPCVLQVSRIGFCQPVFSEPRILTSYQMPGVYQERVRPSGIEARSIPRGGGGLPASYEAPRGN